MEEQFRLAVVGSRSFKDKERLFAQLDKLKNIDLLISGGAIGTDSFAQEYAKKKGLNIMILYPRWQKEDGTRDLGAGYKRNIEIIKIATHVLIVWDGKSRGTAHDIEIAKREKKPTKIMMFDSNDEQEQITKDEPDSMDRSYHDDRGDN